MAGPNTSRATVLQGIQVGKELVPGFGGAATVRLKNMQVNPVPEIPVAVVKYPGSKGATDTQVSQSSAQMSVSGVLDFNTLPLFFDCMFGGATPSEPGGGTAQLRTWNPAVAGALPHPDTLVVESGSARGAERMTFSFMSGLSVRWGREEASIEGTMIGQEVQRGITITPSLDPLTPAAAHPKNIAVFLSTDGTAYTKLQNVISGEVNLNGLWAPTYFVNDDNPSFREVHEMMPEFGAQLVLEEGTEADSFMTYLTGSQLVYLGIRAVGNLLESGSGVVDPTGAPTLISVLTGGTMAAGTYYVKYSYKNGSGETVLSTASRIVTTGTTSRIAVNAGPLPLNATGINVYLSTDNTTFTKHGTSSTGTYIIGSTTVSGSAPGSNSTGTPPIYELIRINLPVLVTQPNPGDQDSVYGNTFTMVMADDESFGMADITIINGIDSY